MERSWEELAELVLDRRTRLGRSQVGVAEVANKVLGERSLTDQTVRIFEKVGRDGYRRQTLSAISVGLDWPPDALQRLQAGDDPASLETASTAEAPPWEELLEGQRRVTEALERLADRLEDRG